MAAPITVLHVDDDPDFVELAAQIIEREHPAVSVAAETTVADGLSRLETDSVDCVVSDYDMPSMTGLEFLEAVREDHPDLPFILFTGKGSEEIASEAISAGVTDYLQKAGGTEQFEILSNRVANAVAERRARQRATELERIDTVVREINRALVRASTREEIERAVCETLSASDPYVFAWIGEYDAEADLLVPRTSAGGGAEYLEEITIRTDESPEGQGPGGKAIRSGKVAVSQNLREDPDFEPWRDAAIEQGFQALAAVPLEHEGTLYGMLGAYADRPYAFDDEERALLADLGDDIAHAIHAIDARTQLEAQYQRLFEEAPVMYAVTRNRDGEPIVEDCNRRFLTTLGYDRDAVIGRPLADLYTAESADRLLDGGGYDRALSASFTREERQFETSDGQVVETLLRAVPRFDDGTVVGTLTLYVDVTDRKRAEDVLRRATAMEAAIDGMAITNADGQFIYANGAYAALFGYDDADALVGTSWRGRYDDEELARLDGAVLPALRSEGRYRGEAVGQRRDGSTFPQELSLTALEDGGLVFVVRDSTERRRMAAEIRAERDRFAALFENVTEPTVDVSYEDERPIVQAVNPAFEAGFGYPAEEIVGESLDDFIVPDGREAEAAALNERLFAAKGFEAEVRRKTTDGVRDFLLRTATIPSDDEEPRCYGIYTDITDRKRRERRVESLNRAMHDLLRAETAEDAAAVVAEAGRDVLGFARVAVRLRSTDGESLEPAAVVGGGAGVSPIRVDGPGPVAESFDRGEPIVQAGDRGTAADGGATPVETALHLPLGRYGVVSAADVDPTTLDESNQQLGAILAANAEAVLERLAEERARREREAELERQNERLEAFAGVVSHDLRNPLSVAMGAFEAYRDTGGDSHAEQVDRAHRRIAEIIDDVLALAKQRGPVTEPTAVAVDTVARAAWANVDTADASLRVDLETPIIADEGLLQQLLENLLRNAVEHGDPDATVAIEDYDDGFAVSDDGPGIPPGDREAVIEYGYTTGDTGTGFGLTIVSDVAAAHGWELTIDESPLGGARVAFSGVDRP